MQEHLIVWPKGVLHADLSGVEEGGRRHREGKKKSNKKKKHKADDVRGQQSL